MMSRGVILHLSYNFIAVIAPLIIIPHLIKALGVDNYGELALIQLLSFSTLAVVDFGLGVVGPKLLVEAKTRGQQPEEAGRMLLVHVLAWIVSSVVILLWILIRMPEYWGIFMISQIAVLAAFFPPVYLLVEKGGQSLYGAIGAVSRIVHLLVVVILVKSPNETWVYFLSNALISSVASALLYRKYCKEIVYPIKDIAEAVEFFGIIRLGFGQFIRRAASIPIFTLIPMALIEYQSKTDIALYSILDKLRTLVWQVMGPVLSAFVPLYFKREASAIDREKMLSARKKAFYIFFLLYLFVAIVLNLSKDRIFNFLGFQLNDAMQIGWWIGTIGIFSAILLAYVMALYSPQLMSNRSLTIKIWIYSVIVCLSIVPVAIHIGIFGVVILGIMWELGAVALMLIELNKNNRRAT